jgi:hypothetical protein
MELRQYVVLITFGFVLAVLFAVYVAVGFGWVTLFAGYGYLLIGAAFAFATLWSACMRNKALTLIFAVPSGAISTSTFLIQQFSMRTDGFPMHGGEFLLQLLAVMIALAAGYLLIRALFDDRQVGELARA